MGGILFKHNRRAYESAICLMEETGLAAVIHPTGTGKSFIAFQLCADHPEKNICWLSPSEYIYKTQKEKWLLAGGQEMKNIKFITYAKLMRMQENDLLELSPSYIILDEFHRLGAAKWGRGVEILCKAYPQAKILGLSATNIRYLDNQRDMAWELFDGNIASELTLGAAIATGILPAPNYVLSVYLYRRELARYAKKVQQTKNKMVRDRAEKELEALRRALEKADGLTEVFKKHMIPGKYIVFCANYKHLSEMRELASEWFAGVDSAPHIYTVYSEDPITVEEFEAFKVDNSEHLRLLYCIDMLNEGIHVDGLTGVILLRPTVSPTIYKQQIGRALAAGGKETPVIFDIVMNIENLCSIGAIEEELREAVLFCRANGRADEIVKEHFQIIDELGDCRKLFTQLNETLSASWDAMYRMAKEYYAKYHNLEIPRHYVTSEGYSLGAWLDTQRKVYTGKTAGNLSAVQVEKLEKIGMNWQGSWEQNWEKSYAAACEYYKEHGDLNVPAVYVSADGERLGRWIRRQKEMYQKYQKEKEEGRKQKTDGLMGKENRKEIQWRERFKKLEEIGMVWENGASWERRFALAKEYYEEHGNLKMPADYVVEGIWLERWLREQKEKLAIDEETGSNHNFPRKLSIDQKEKLHSIGLYPGVSQAELSWRQQYEEAEEFYRKHGNLSIPRRYAARSGKDLGVWLQRQRAGYRSGCLAAWQVQMLDGIGMIWEFADPWETGFQHAREYFYTNGHLMVPNNYICADGYRLGKWISNQRFTYGKTAGKALEERKIKQLESIGMVWNAKPGRRSVKTY